MKSLSLALADLTKESDIIIGVKHISQSYFLTSERNCSLKQYQIIMAYYINIIKAKILLCSQKNILAKINKNALILKRFSGI